MVINEWEVTEKYHSTETKNLLNTRYTLYYRISLLSNKRQQVFQDLMGKILYYKKWPAHFIVFTDLMPYFMSQFYVRDGWHIPSEVYGAKSALYAPEEKNLSIVHYGIVRTAWNRVQQ